MTIELRPDGRQSETALAVQRGVGRLMRSLGFAILNEFTLATGRRADVIALGDSGAIWIIEIKSSLEDFRVDQKWPEYREFCDRFFFAIPQTLDPEVIPYEAGLIVADNWGAEILRQSGELQGVGRGQRGGRIGIGPGIDGDHAITGQAVRGHARGAGRARRLNHATELNGIGAGDADRRGDGADAGVDDTGR